MKHIIAIDPGASGGIAYKSDAEIIAVPMPETDADIAQAILTAATAITNSLNPFSQNTVEVWVEQVGGYIGTACPGSAMFSFGKNFGLILGVCAARHYRVNLVTPQKWQKHFSLGTVKSTGGKGPWKRKLKEKAQQLFPTVDVTLKTSDALLIYEYATKQL